MIRSSVRFFFLATAISVAIFFGGPTHAQPFAGGTGTISDPYQISTPVHLYNIRENLSAHYIQINDIDLNVAPFNEGYGWTPIGNSSMKFMGSFNGQGFTISNMYMDRTNNDYCGLFGYITSLAVIKNTCLIEMDVKAKGYTGGIAGYNEGRISCCYTTGIIEGAYNVGGITGRNSGIASYTGTIIHCYSLAYVKATTTTGRGGGLAGENYYGTIVHCYASGGVSVPGSNGGGLIGYATGDSVGCCFWNTETSAQLSSQGGTGITIEEMRTATTYTNAGWDFSNIWSITDGYCYPYLLPAAQDPPPNPDPFTILNLQELDSIRYFTHGHYILGRDLDFSNDSCYAQLSGWEAVKTTMTTGNGFEPIGNTTTKFTGRFDGNGFRLTHLYIDRPAADNVGLFGCVGGAGIITNTGLIQSNVTGRNFTGVVAGYNEGTISSCYSNGYLVANSYLGGITGKNDGQSSLRTGKVSDCYSQAYIAALAATSRAGGLIGENYYGTVLNCYSSGGVGALSNGGGLIGNNSYGTVNSSFWNMETSAQLSSAGGTPVTMEEMKSASTFTSAGWDFSNVWSITDQVTYPWLKDNVQVPPPAPDPIIITTIQELDSMRYLLHGHYRLGNELDFNNDSSYAHIPGWESYKYSLTTGNGFLPVGTSAQPFTGLLDGAGFSIKNLFINRPSENSVGFFGVLGGAGEVRKTGVKDANVTGNQLVGIVSGTNEGTISMCYSSGLVYGYTQAGGLAGYVTGLSGNRKGMIINSYCMADVIGTNIRIGGITGYLYYGTLRNCYSTGSVSGFTTVGGLVGGSNMGVVDSCFWNVESSSQNSSMGGGRGLTTLEMMTDSTFIQALWDFSTIWAIDHGISYPWLQSNVQTPLPAPDPIEIFSIQDLDSIRHRPFGGYRLMKNLDFNSDTCYEHHAGWESFKAAMISDSGFIPIGNQSLHFTGLFDGNGHTIRNLYINRPGTDFVGLFGYFSGTGTINHLALEYVSITGKDYTGCVTGYNSGSIEECYSSGIVRGNNFTGGIAGKCDGLLPNNSGLISNCYSLATVAGNQKTGGIAGQLYYANIEHCYAAGGVTGASEAGGLIGAVNMGTVVNSCWNSEMSSRLTSMGGTGVSTWQMMLSADFISAGWDFTQVWDIAEDESYPWLRSVRQIPPPGPVFAGISTIQDLDNIRNNLQGHYQLLNDLDFNDDNSYAQVPGWETYKTAMTTGSGFVPVGQDSSPFTGVLEGNGKTITNLYINRPEADYTGLFGSFNGAGAIKNLGLLQVNISGNDYTGSITGHHRAKISRCYISGSINGHDYTGSLAGRLDGLSVHNKGEISDCYTFANVTGNNYVGGITGSNYYGRIANCFSAGSITGVMNHGGIAGNSYAGSTTASYWNTETSGQGFSAGGEGRNTVQMTHPYDGNTYSGWNFLNIWAGDTDHTINNGYPFLGFPLAYAFPDLVLPSGENACTESSQIVSVAGGGSLVKVKSGAILEAVAGQRVYLLDGTVVKSGGYLHAWIDPGGNYCGFNPDISFLSGQHPSETITGELYPADPWYAVYPNPTSGLFIIEIVNDDLAPVKAALYDISGTKLALFECKTAGKFAMDISHLTAGIYILRLTSSGYHEHIKLIRK